MRREQRWHHFVAKGWLASAGLTFVAVRMWKLRLQEAEHRADEAERTREAEAQRRAAEERLRIARELHDSLTHSISVVNVQAGVAAHLARKRGEEVSPALLAIQEASADAARELRAALDVLRRDESNGTGLDRLPRLVEHASSAGVPTTLTITGAPRPLPADVDRAAYRIVQEALTNVTRHAGAAQASIRLDYAPATLTLQVDDDGCGSTPGPVTPGLGLIGMRERVSALDGRMWAEARADGGFTVWAELPLRVGS